MNDLPFHLIADEHETFTREEKSKKKDFLSSLTDDAVDLYEAWVSNPGVILSNLRPFFRLMRILSDLEIKRLRSQRLAS